MPKSKLRKISTQKLIGVKRKISLFTDVKVFNITLHNVDIVLNGKWSYHIEKMNTGKKITLSTNKFKNKKGHRFPFFRRPKTIELRSKEGSIKIGISEVIYNI